MTDEERQKLIADLSFAFSRKDKHGYYGPLCGKAADEIKRLAKHIRELEKQELCVLPDGSRMVGNVRLTK
jgi:hypothetical protein